MLWKVALVFAVCVSAAALFTALVLIPVPTSDMPGVSQCVLYSKKHRCEPTKTVYIKPWQSCDTMAIVHNMQVEELSGPGCCMGYFDYKAELARKAKMKASGGR